MSHHAGLWPRHTSSAALLFAVAVVLFFSLRLAVPDASATAPAGNSGELSTGSWSLGPPAPLQPRSGQSSVWTGKEVLVWGGQSAIVRADGLPVTMYANGAVYRPGDRRWQRMPAGPLSPREGMAATWAGHQAFFWGGGYPVMSGYQDYDSGAMYNPATTSWRMLRAGPLSPRRGAEAFWTGSKVIVFGGQGATPNTVPLAAASYDPARGTWAELPEFPPSGPGTAVSTTAAWTGSQLLAVVTYEHVVQIPCAKPCTYADTISSHVVVAAWAPGQTSWQVLQAAMPKGQAYMPTYMAQAIWAGHQLDILGGSVCLPGMSCPMPLGPGGWAESFDPATRSWQPLGPEVGAGSTWPAAWTGQALVVIDVGQYQGNNAPFSGPGSAASFEPDSRTWVPLPTVPTGVLTTANAAWTGQDLLVWGSYEAGSEIAASLAPGKATNLSKEGDGRVDGRAQYCSGALPGARPPAGFLMHVSVLRASHTVSLQFVAAPFLFHFDLPAASYTVEADGDRPQRVTVRAGNSERVLLHADCG